MYADSNIKYFRLSTLIHQILIQISLLSEGDTPIFLYFRAGRNADQVNFLHAPRGFPFHLMRIVAGPSES